jgi:hypothetical protein
MSGVGLDPTGIRRLRMWQAVCECGWVGIARDSRELAEADRDTHVVTCPLW